MSFRKAREAGNQGRGTVIEAICWKQRMHLVAGSRHGEKAHAVGTAGDVQSHINPPGPSRRLNSDQAQLLGGVTGAVSVPVVAAGSGGFQTYTR